MKAIEKFYSNIKELRKNDLSSFHYLDPFIFQETYRVFFKNEITIGNNVKLDGVEFPVDEEDENCNVLEILDSQDYSFPIYAETLSESILTEVNKALEDTMAEMRKRIKIYQAFIKTIDTWNGGMTFAQPFISKEKAKNFILDTANEWIRDSGEQPEEVVNRLENEGKYSVTLDDDDFLIAKIDEFDV